MKEQPALLDAYRAGAVCMVNGFRSKIIHKKALFAVLTDARFRRLFTSDEQQMIAGHVPWTRKVCAGKSDYYGDQIDLLEFINDRRDRLVLKPNDDYGGHGIYIGWNIDEIGWDEAIHNALANGDYLVQERVQTARETFPALTPDDKIEFVEQLVDLDPLLFNGKVGSAFTRLSSNELANVTAGGGMVPTFVIRKK
jgi:uncharacterized circularly permuted ATP-grasp superfamily protein